MMRIAGWMAAVVLVVGGVVRAEGVATTRGSVVEGTRTSTAVSAGKWTNAVRTNESRALGANAEAIWFGAGSTVWRYNAKEKKIDVVEAFLLERQRPNDALSADGRLALGFEGATVLWEKGKWTMLPQPGGEDVFFEYAFDKDGHLWGTSWRRAYRWNEGVWDPSIGAGQVRRMWNVGDGWLARNDDFSKRAEWSAAFVSRRFDKFTPYDLKREESLSRDVYQIGGRTLGMVTEARKGVRICEFSKDGCSTLVQGKRAGIDLKTGEAFALEEERDGSGWQILDALGKAVGMLPKWPETTQNYGIVLRDANGDYWRRHYRLVGKVWKAEIPGRGMEIAGRLFDELGEGRLRFDGLRGAWVAKGPAGSEGLRLYDEKARTGWRARGETGMGGPAIWERVRVKEGGETEVLETVEFPKELRFRVTPLFVDREGDTWFTDFFRYDGKTLHFYGEEKLEGEREVRTFRELMRSPGGSVWMQNRSGVLSKYDRKRGEFVEGDPFEEFAFEVAGRRFSVVSEGVRWPSPMSGIVGVLYEKSGEAWLPVENPFGEEPLFTRRTRVRRGGMYVMAGVGVRGDRILVSGKAGAFEWDVKGDRWAYLAPVSISAFYDDAGRKVILADGETVLVHEGDAMAGDAAMGEKIRSELKEVVRRMDADSWAERESAVADGVRLMRKNPTLVGQVLVEAESKAGTSAELRERIQRVLQSKVREAHPLESEWEAGLAKRTGTSLLERMEGRRKVEMDLRIRVGMDIEQVRSACAAAKALRSRGIWTLAEDRSYEGFELGDGTVLYLRLENTDGTGKVVKMGLGKTGERWDRDWDWENAEKNGLKEVDLEKHEAGERATQPR